jgi:Calcineurin-like phosphoesterase
MKIPNPVLVFLQSLVCFLVSAMSATVWAAPKKPEPWTFVVSGDSRNCGNVVMPSIAAGAHAHRAAFYWHLGDLRAIYDFDEDFRSLHPKAPILEYLKSAWPDFERSQIEAFGDTPFFLGIGNHETIAPKTREEFTLTFADWLDAPPIREQRLKDDPHDHTVRTYYHWIRDGIDFITLDNATIDQFDAAQLKWLNAVLQRDRQDTTIRALVVGMHEALPDSIARGHSMSDSPTAEVTGAEVYAQLLEVQKDKPVYVLASHSHYVMAGIFDTPYWHEHGGVLPGWIIGTGGAYRYALPPGAGLAMFAKTHVYGYLLATVSAPGSNTQDPVKFEFQEVTEAMTPPDVVQKYGAEFIRRCHQENAQSLAPPSG